jgi:predicted ArsR family transcriptional regulator
MANEARPTPNHLATTLEVVELLAQRGSLRSGQLAEEMGCHRAVVLPRLRRLRTVDWVQLRMDGSERFYELTSRIVDLIKNAPPPSTDGRVIHGFHRPR